MFLNCRVSSAASEAKKSTFVPKKESEKQSKENINDMINDDSETNETADNNQANPETPATGTKGIARYSDIRGKFSNLLGNIFAKFIQVIICGDF